MSTRAPEVSARDRLLAAADELFYKEGIHTVGIDRVIERAGVAKASLYNTFGSKDELVQAYLARRHAARQVRITAMLARHDAPRDRLLGVFDVLEERFADPKFRGCAFVNASAEGAPRGKTRNACTNARAWIRALFVELARDAGARDPDHLAAQLVVLYDGATVGAQMDGDPAVASVARAMAATLLDLATGATAG